MDRGSSRVSTGTRGSRSAATRAVRNGGQGLGQACLAPRRSSFKVTFKAPRGLVLFIGSTEAARLRRVAGLVTQA